MALIRAISLDFDGALFNDAFHYHKDIIAANKILLDRIIKNEQGYASTTLYIGTNRQSVNDDHANAIHNKTGSAFPHLVQLKQHLKQHLKRVSLDKFLLTDLYHQLKAGKSFNEALTLLGENSNYYDRDKLQRGSLRDWLHDESKLTVLYAQIHRFAKKNPKDTLDFHFYDDREDILDSLYAYFFKNRDRLPGNLCLRLHRYQGGSNVSDYPTIQGTGEIDRHYKTTVRQMAKAAIESPQFQQKSPANSKGKPVLAYEEAEQNNFVLTIPFHCIRDCQLIKNQPYAAPKASREENSSSKNSPWQPFIKPQSVTPYPFLRQPTKQPSEPSHIQPETHDNLTPLAVMPDKAATPIMGEEKTSPPIPWQFYKPSKSPSETIVIGQASAPITARDLPSLRRKAMALIQASDEDPAFVP